MGIYAHLMRQSDKRIVAEFVLVFGSGDVTCAIEEHA